MKFSKSQKADLALAEWFIPASFRFIPITDEDRRKYLGWSERGEYKNVARSMCIKSNGFSALIWGKKCQGRHIHELWEPGVLSGNVPYWVLLGGCHYKEIMPRNVVDLMKREMFKGVDAELIEKVYCDVTRYWSLWRRIVQFTRDVYKRNSREIRNKVFGV